MSEKFSYYLVRIAVMKVGFSIISATGEYVIFNPPVSQSLSGL